MADCLDHEQNSVKNEDSDRLNDKLNFRRYHFNIFKHNIREVVEEGASNETQLNTDIFTLGIDQKKTIVNTIQKLKKAENSLNKFPNNSSVQPLILKICEIRQKLSSMIQANVDYSPSNAPLPEYDQDDIAFLNENLLKPEAINEEKDALQQWYLQTKNNMEENIAHLLGGADILFNETKDILNIR